MSRKFTSFKLCQILYKSLLDYDRQVGKVWKVLKGLKKCTSCASCASAKFLHVD